MPALTAVLLLPSFAYAQESKASTKLVVPSIVLGTMNGLDVWTTRRAVESGHGREGNAFVNGSTWRQIAVKAGPTTVAIFLARKLEPKHPRLAKGVLYGLAGVIGSVALHNEAIARR